MVFIINLSLVPALSKIRESTRINITVILISSLTFDHFLEYCPTIPYSIHFKTYSENEILDILALSKPSNVDHTFYRTFVNIIYQNFKLAINDVKEYLYFCQVLFPIYCEPIKTGKALNTETGKLYKLIDKVLKDNIEKILLHQQFHVGKSKVTSQLSFDLPFCTKFLLIAGFLASFNPSKLDKRYFTKTGETLGKKGGIKRAIRKEKISSSLLGPKAFPVERMIAIYHAIFTQKIQESNDISIQIATLINLGLITRVGNDPLNSVKCKCNVGMSAIKSIANKIGFQLDNYLHY